MYSKFVKRFLDIILSTMAIVALSPIYLVIAICVRVQMGSPILFSQDRIAKDEKIFKLYKFRSMISATEKNGKPLTDKERLTKFGTALRSTSLDELPELFMILKGDMSIIGPRPQPSFYLPYYKKEERVAHKVRGGLLPPDSLCKEVQCDWETQMKYESYYAEHVSFALDVKVVLCTFVILYKRMKYNYGADDRPMLHEYRAGTVSEKELEKWKEKGIEIR
ncbi:sugar transferase [Dorea sp.]